MATIPVSSHSSAEGLLKIGDFARLAQTNLRTLRYYEELGVLEPAARSSGGFRYYRSTDTHRLETIRDLQHLGLNLGQIRELLATRVSGATRQVYMARVREALQVQERLLSGRITELEQQREALIAAQAKLSQCERCEHTPASGNNFCQPCQVTGEDLPSHVSALF